MNKNLTLMIVFAVSLTFISCSDDSKDASVSTSLTGAYRLTVALLPELQDYDKDSDSSTNAVLEGGCYNDSWISFHSNGTYDQSISKSSTAALGLLLDANTIITSGTYVRSGNTVTTLATGSGDTTVFTFDSDHRTLAVIDHDASYASWNAVTSLWTTSTGELRYIFTKYTDDDQDNGKSADHNGLNDDENNANFELLGNFSLNAYTVPTAQNLNSDSGHSTNLVNESSCYGQTSMMFHQNGTYEEQRVMPVIAADMRSLSCITENIHGNWKCYGNIITTTRTGVGAGSKTTTYTFNKNSHALTSTDHSGAIPNYNPETSLYKMLYGNVKYTYRRN